MGDAADTLAERLKGLRVAKGESQEDVAREIRCNAGTYSRWERGVSTPHSGEIVALSRHFGCTTDYLLIGGTLTEQEIPRELHRFLATKWGRYATKRNMVSMLRQISVMPDGHPPTVQSYTRFVKRWFVEEDNEADDFEDDPPKAAH